MNANFEQAFNILQTLNIDLQGFNNYLTNKLNATAINKEVKNVEKLSELPIFQKTNKKWGDYDDDDEVTSNTCSVSDTVSLETSSNSESVSLNYLSAVSSAKNDTDGFKPYVSKKMHKKQNVRNEPTNPMLKDYGLDESHTVLNRMVFARAITEKWEIGTDYQIHPDALCPTMMEGNICNEYFECVHLHRCKYVHLHRCKYETSGKICTNSNCKFLHARDMPTKEAHANFQRTIK